MNERDTREINTLKTEMKQNRKNSLELINFQDLVH